MPARLLVEAGDAAPSTVELKPDQPVSLGRNRHNHVILRGQHTSRQHAEIFFRSGRWYLRDCDTTNGTRLNGQRIRETVLLQHDAVITIGDARLRFILNQTESTATVSEVPPTPEPEAEDPSTTLQANELSTLVRFLNDAVKETTPQGLLKRALTVLRRQTGADLCGCLSLDVDDPLPRVVVPNEGKVDAQLSRELTREVVKTSRAIWLAQAHSGAPDSDSLAHFSDAICVPLLGTPGSARRETPLGAVHVYKFNRNFSSQQFRFCEALAESLANNLRSLRSRRALEADVSRLRSWAPTQGDDLVGSSKGMQSLREEIDLLAGAHCTVLIQGESGVGKELVALRLHLKSPRCEGPLVPVNCATIVASMPEAELFGHEKGAFTGADRARPGHFQLADEGTLFLDEIGELTLECQAKLLRVLADKTSFRPLGSDYPVTVDVRLVAATNRDLQKEVKEGRFREDLFYRLAVGRISVPPLREHAEDIPELADYFLHKINEVNHKQVRLTESALQRLMAYPWPGNVRQLRSVLEAAIVRARRDAQLEPTDLRLDIEAVPLDRPPSLNLEEVEAWVIRQVLTQTEWNNTQAAQILGIARGTLIDKIKKYRLEP